MARGEGEARVECVCVCVMCVGDISLLSVGVPGISSRLSLYFKLFVTVIAGNSDLIFFIFCGCSRALFVFFLPLRGGAGDQRTQQRVYAHQHVVELFLRYVYGFPVVCWPGVSTCRQPFLDCFSPLSVCSISLVMNCDTYTGEGLGRCCCYVLAGG